MAYGLTFVVALGLRLALSYQEGAQPDEGMVVELPTSIPASGESAQLTDPGHYLSLNPAERMVGLTGWAARASRSALVSWLEGRPACSALEWRVLLTRWAELDTKGFRSAAVALIEDDEPFGEAAVDEVLLEIARQKVRERPQDSIARLESDDPLLHTAYEAWLRQDRVAAMQAIEALPEGDERLALLETAAKVWASQEPEKALEWAIGREGEEQDLVEAVFAELTSTNPDKAWAMLKEHGQQVVSETKDENDFVIGSLRTLFDRAAARDPGEALDWLARIGDDDAMLKFVEASSQLPQQIDGDLAEWIERLPFGKAREQLAIHMAFLKHSSLGERLEAVADLEGVDQDRLVGKMVKMSASDSSGVIANMDAWKDLPNETRSSIVRSVIGLGFNQSPSEAASWLRGLPSGVAEPSHFSKLWRTWTGLEPEMASGQLELLDAGPLRDGAIQGLVEGIATGRSVVIPDFEAAWQWAQTMTSSPDRQKMISDLEEAWREDEPEAANEFLEHER